MDTDFFRECGSSIVSYLAYSRAYGSLHRPLLMGEVSKSAGGGRRRLLRDRDLCEFDSVKKVSMLIDGGETMGRWKEGEIECWTDGRVECWNDGTWEGT